MSDETKDPNSPKYLVMIIGLLATMAFGAYQIITYDAQDEMCAHLEKEIKKATARGQFEGEFQSVSSIREMQQSSGCIPGSA